MFELWLTGFIIGGVLGIALYLGYCWIVETAFDKGYWAGRSAGWKSCLDHQAKVKKLKLDQVFDYEKN